MYYYEIAVTAQSVILGFACARVLHATPHLFFKLCDLKIYLVWYVLCLHILIAFWTTMNITKLPDFDFLDFVLLMIYSGVSFIMCDSVFPSNSDKISSWENHYFTINKIFWVCNILCALTLIIDIEKSRHIALGEDYYILYFIGILPWIIYSLAAYFYQKSKVQWIVLILLTVNYTFNALSTFLNQEAKF